MASSPERPNYFEGQYLGAADLAAAVDYARQSQRIAALAGQSWGIHIGLDLVEQDGSDGGTDYFVLPGCATDGYGRLIVVATPAPVPAALFDALPTGNQMVWIRYDEGERRGLRPGWQTCGDQDQFSRIRESFRIEAGPHAPLEERQSGLDVAGLDVPDARQARIAVDEDAPLICDGSIPYQDFPEDDVRWLVPLGVANWTNGVPGSLGPRTLDVRKVSRSMRRYAGQVAESIHAADGVIRLRDRYTERNEALSVDDQCAAAALRAEDLEEVADPADSTATRERLVGSELVWIEGHSRLLGDARLWGTRLEFRADDGRDNGQPLYLARGDAATGGDIDSLELALGASTDGKARLLIGATKPSTLETRLQFINDGRLAVGGPIPGDVKQHRLLATSSGDTSISIASGSGKVGKLEFSIGAALSEAASLAYDDDVKVLRLGLGTDMARFAGIDADGRMGIRTLEPVQADGDADDLVIVSPDMVGITLLSDTNSRGRINFADDPDDPAAWHAGSIVYHHSANRMELHTLGDPRVSITSVGRVGIGTTAPSSQLQIESPTDNRRLRLDADVIRAEDGGTASLLTLQPGGGGLQVGSNVRIDASGRVGLGTTTPSSAIHVTTPGSQVLVEQNGSSNPRLTLETSGGTQGELRLDRSTGRLQLRNKGQTALTADGNRVGINIGTGGPTVEFHARGSKSDSANNITAHVALIENMAGSNADVLALRVNRTVPQSDNNFVTFFGGSIPCGKIEGNGAGGITFSTSGADFAERLPRASDQPIGPSRIVGVHRGRVSLTTSGAESLHITTDRPAVLGNADPSETDRDFEKVAFVGQVPLTVEGPVAPGDFIVPAGNNDGIGRAARAGDPLAQTVGRVWSGSVEEGRGQVMVAIGLPGTTPADRGATLVEEQQRCIELLLERIDRLEQDRV